jgi:hypothetical protein
MRTSPKKTIHLVGPRSETKRHARAVLRLMAYAMKHGHEVRLDNASFPGNQNAFWYLVITPNNIED